jgi:UDP-N-acetylglucosamine--N-acetylmuramyl-(pentapeptide) pyrophosphoryl-undecaprenol N-acetylglucosamine transferase
MFAGGGTGGHLMPGAAVARALCLLMPHTRCLFLTTQREQTSPCAEAISEFEIAHVQETRWDGMVRKAMFPFRSARAAIQVHKAIQDFRPHVLIGLGGHNSVVPCMLARMSQIRTALFESNAVPGAAVRLLAPFADRVMVQWPAAARGMFARRVSITGNPVRPAVLEGNREAAAARLGISPLTCTMLVLGGSQGALALNRAIWPALRLLQEGGTVLQVIHLTGPAHLREAEQRSRGLRGYRAFAFMHRMGDAYAAADFVLARAGGSTLAEVTALGLPAILVPYPFAASDHQLANAELLSKAGAAIKIRQSELTEQRLARAMERLAGDSRCRRAMARASSGMGRPLAAMTVAAEIADLAGFGLHRQAHRRQADSNLQALQRAA